MFSKVLQGVCHAIKEQMAWHDISKNEMLISVTNQDLLSWKELLLQS